MTDSRGTGSGVRRRVLITGGNRGIGRELAAQLADEGYTVVLTARDGKAASTTAEALTDGYPQRRIVPLELDVTNPDSIASAAIALDGELGGLDVLVNNAGIHYDYWQRAVDADLTVAEEALQTNLLGPWRVTLAMLPLLRRGMDARIVNVSSEAASMERMGPSTPAYSTSKAALNALTRTMAAELADEGIIVHAASPGHTATDMGGENGRPIREGVASIRHVIQLPASGGSGGFYQDGQHLPW